MKRQVSFLLILILLAFQNLLFSQSNSLPLYKDADAYEVYSAILSFPLTWKQFRKSYVIRRETLSKFGALKDIEGEYPSCLRPNTESAKIIGEAINDHIKVNKIKWQLQEKFSLEIPYRLVSSDQLFSIIDQEEWVDFYKKYPDSGGFIDLSAVGFNADKTVAVVSKGRWCGGTCGSGDYYVLQKKNGKWIELKWTGSSDGCTWMS